jgi:hypothetical protein
VTAEARELGANEPVVTPHHVGPRLVAEPRCELGGPAHVGKEDRREDAVRLAFLRVAEQESLELFEHRLRCGREIADTGHRKGLRAAAEPGLAARRKNVTYQSTKSGSRARPGSIPRRCSAMKSLRPHCSATRVTSERNSSIELPHG